MTDPVVNDFLAYLRGQSTPEDHVRAFAAHIATFRADQPFLATQRLTAIHLQTHLAAALRLGTSQADLRNRTVAVEALLAYLAATYGAPASIVPEPPARPAPAAPQVQPPATVLPCARANLPMRNEAPTPLLDLVLRPWTRAGAMVSVALALPILCGILPLIGFWMPLLYYPGLVGYYFLTIDHVGREHSGLPTFEAIDLQSVVEKLLKGLVCALAILAPLAFALLSEPALFSEPGEHWVLLWGSVVLGALLGPAVILAVYVTGSKLAAFHPGAWWHLIRNFSADYFHTAWVFALILAVIVTVHAVTDVLFGPVGIAVACVRGFVLNLVWLSQACVLGEFVRRNAEELGADY